MNIPDHAHHHPPDSAGWWYIHTLLLTQPYLVYLGEARLQGIQKTWAKTSTCWKLSSAVDTPVERILTAALGQPQLVWELAMAMRSLRVAGLWEHAPARTGIEHHVRSSPTGERIAIVRGNNKHGWSYQGANIPQGSANTLDEAKSQADEALMNIGYLLGKT